MLEDLPRDPESANWRTMADSGAGSMVFRTATFMLVMISVPSAAQETSLPFNAGKHYSLANWLENHCGVTTQKAFNMDAMSKRQMDGKAFRRGMSEGISIAVGSEDEHGKARVCKELIEFYGPNSTSPFKGSVR